jgi:hypothetical protein
VGQGVSGLPAGSRKKQLARAQAIWNIVPPFMDEMDFL